MGKVHVCKNHQKATNKRFKAGKVKSQTPKVEKQEKKKVPKGRAKKRLTYTRRFVNISAQIGGKRKMNPSPAS